MAATQKTNPDTNIRQKLAAIMDIGAVMEKKELTQKQRNVWGRQLKQYAKDILTHLEG